MYKQTVLRAGGNAQLVAEGLGLLNQAGVLSDENKAVECCNELVNVGNGVKDRVDALIFLDKLQKRRLAVHMIAQGSRASHCFFSKLSIDNLSNIAAKVFELNEDQLAIKIDQLNKMHVDEGNAFQKNQCIIL